jgi:hypothetical protein
VYAGGKINSGEAIFHDLVSSIDLEYSYIFATLAETDLSGSYRLHLRISEPNGWQRTIPLQADTQFEGISFQTKVQIDVDEIDLIVERLKERTGLGRQLFNADIIVSTDIEGSVDNKQYKENFLAVLPMSIDEIELYVSAQGPLVENGDPFKPTQKGFIPDERIIANTLTIMGFEIEMLKARKLSVISGSISVLLAALIIIPNMVVSIRNENERIRMNFSEYLLDVTEIPADSDVHLIEVAHFDDLVKLAHSSGDLIFHSHQEDKHTYAVKDAEIVYMYTSYASGEGTSDRQSSKDKDVKL